MSALDTNVLVRFTAGRADFADSLLGVHAERRGAEPTWTFDAKLRGAKGFRVP